MKGFLTILFLTVLAPLKGYANKELSDKDLVQRWSRVTLDIASIINNGSDFYKSVALFASDKRPYQSSEALLVKQTLYDDLSDLTTIHIMGSLEADIVLIDAGQVNEVIIAGDIAEGAVIYSSGISVIYVGGAFNGRIESTGSLQLTIRENFTGTLFTGEPSTFIDIAGDMSGNISQLSSERWLLYIKVDGFTPKQIIKNIYQHNYTSIAGFFRHSNHTIGIFEPDGSRIRRYAVANHRAIEQ